jgi:hypothetical protein
MHRPRRPALGRPIFLDRSGRRRKLVLMAGAFVGVVLVASLGLLAAGLTGASPTHVPGFPDAVRQVEEASPAPSDSSSLSSSSPSPASTPDPSQQAPGTLPTPGASPVATSHGHDPTHTPSHAAKPTRTR